MSDAKTAFSIMFIMLGLILGTLFGAFVVAKDHGALILLAIPSLFFLISACIGFMEVFTKD